jgi:hypothetical protein
LRTTLVIARSGNCHGLARPEERSSDVHPDSRPCSTPLRDRGHSALSSGLNTWRPTRSNLFTRCYGGNLIAANVWRRRSVGPHFREDTQSHGLPDFRTNTPISCRFRAPNYISAALILSSGDVACAVFYVGRGYIVFSIRRPRRCRIRVPSIRDQRSDLPACPIPLSLQGGSANKSQPLAVSCAAHKHCRGIPYFPDTTLQPYRLNAPAQNKEERCPHVQSPDSSQERFSEQEG